MRTLLLACVAVALWLFLTRKSQGATAQGGNTLGAAPAYEADYDQPSRLDAIVEAVIHAESRGRQTDSQGNTLRSKAGALGIMQLMPGTAAQLGVNPNDEAQNVAGGTAYLESLFQKYGKWFDALAAYNWGPGHVDRAQAAGQSYPASVADYASGILSRAGGN